MKRVAEALHRNLPVPSTIRYIYPGAPPILKRRLPRILVHTLYVMHTQRQLHRVAAQLAPCEIAHIVDHSESFLLPAVRASLRIVHCHDLIPLVESRIYRHQLSRCLGRMLYTQSVRYLPLADGVIACSQATARDVHNLLGVPVKHLRTVPHGVDTDFFTPVPQEIRCQLREKHGFSPREKVLLHVGSNALYKNVPTILHVAASLLDEGHPVKLVKAGQRLTPPLQRLANQLGFATRIVQVENPDDTLLRELYRACDVLVFPSLREGFGLPVLEALACGTPAVVSDAPGLAEWAGAVCPCVPALDVPKMMQAVLRSIEIAYADSERMQLRQFAVQYDWKNIAAQIAQAYREWRG